MKQRARHSFSTTRSSSVNNYDPRELAQRFNESVQKAAEDARIQMRQELEADLTAKLTAQLKDEWNQKEATLGRLRGRPGQAKAGGRRGGSQGQGRRAIGRRESGRCRRERDCDVRETTSFVVVVDSRGRRFIIESVRDLNAT
uniref:Uncharacterized protein n=1 Tax=Opuntia streptacantha TaxID=393608 RepID=A0A7C9ALI8_OPUST